MQRDERCQMRFILGLEQVTMAHWVTVFDIARPGVDGRACQVWQYHCFEQRGEIIA